MITFINLVAFLALIKIFACDKVFVDFNFDDVKPRNVTKRQIITQPFPGQPMLPGVGINPGIGIQPGIITQPGLITQPGVYPQPGIYPQPGMGGLIPQPNGRCYPIVSPPIGGFALYPCQNIPGFTCTFGCSPGFVLIGQRQMLCRPDTFQWSSQPPVCVRSSVGVMRSCSALDAPLNGYKMGTCVEGSPVGSSCMFMCNPNFNIIGPSLLVCQPDGTWGGFPPRCNPITPTTGGTARPPTPPMPPGMTTTGGMVTPRPGQTTMMTSRPVTTMPTQRPPMPPTTMMTTMRPPLPGSTIPGSTIPGSTRPGTTFPGGSTGLPTTMMGTCPPLPQPFNGLARGNCLNPLPNSSCYFSCNIGFVLVGFPVTTCRGNRWTAPPPICRGIPRRFRPVFRPSFGTNC